MLVTSISRGPASHPGALRLKAAIVNSFKDGGQSTKASKQTQMPQLPEKNMLFSLRVQQERSLCHDRLVGLRQSRHSIHMGLGDEFTRMESSYIFARRVGVDHADEEHAGLQSIQFSCNQIIARNVNLLTRPDTSGAHLTGCKHWPLRPWSSPRDSIYYRGFVT